MSGFKLDNNTGKITYNDTEYTETMVPTPSISSQDGSSQNVVKLNLLLDSTVSSTVTITGGNNTVLSQTSGNAISLSSGSKNNYTATTDPGVGDDSEDGYSRGSIWINTSAGKAYICISAVLGSADWNQIDATGGSGTSDHSALTNLSWTNSGHTGQTTAVPAWNNSGTAVTVQATSDEVMLVRRGGILQWVPIVTGALLFSSGFADVESSSVEITTLEISSGTFTTL